jgi:hypothetical protein
MLGPNDEVERRGVATSTNEAALSQSSTPSLAQRRRDPRSLEPIVRRFHRLPVKLATHSTGRAKLKEYNECQNIRDATYSNYRKERRVISREAIRYSLDCRASAKLCVQLEQDRVNAAIEN